MRLATWNVNSIRTRVDRVLAFLEREDIDALAMQEIKCRPDQFPVEPFEAAGYELAIHGLNQWNGVAIASRVGLDDVATSFPGQPAWAAKPEAEPVVEARALGATVGAASDATPVRLWSLYVPNGRELSHPHYTYKLDWLRVGELAAIGHIQAPQTHRRRIRGRTHRCPERPGLDDRLGLGLGRPGGLAREGGGDVVEAHA